MKIAIVGSGFCGLACAYHLLDKEKNITVTLFDSKGIGGGASGMAAGLLHPFAGAHAHLNPLGWEGMVSTKKLLDIASSALNFTVIQQTGILRLALTEKQQEDYYNCSKKHPETIWKEKTICQELYREMTPGPGLWISSGLSINCELYLKGLWKACQKKGALLIIQKINSMKELKDFDLIILAAGYDCKTFINLPLSAVKGQILTLYWPKELPPLPFSLNSQAYLVKDADPRFCHAGSTFERHFSTKDPEVNKAIESIIPKITSMIPKLENVEVIDCRSGIRASTPNHQPIAKKLENNLWCLTGMGSKGLLYHSLFAEQLATTILENKSPRLLA